MKPELPELDPSLYHSASFDSAGDPIVDETLKLPEDLTPDEANHLLGTAFLLKNAHLILP
jgi:hypothetical protein